jgi:putative two-component system response regulator
MAAHLIVAEDNVDIIDVMRDVLEGEGYRVTCANNGLEAYKAFEVDPPDLIVSDVMMPQWDGWQLLEAVRSHARGAAVPFLFLSARTDHTSTSKARLLGADDYLFKPFDADDLCLAVKAKLERRRMIELFDTRSAHLQTVKMLANVIEARDLYTRGHVERVQKYALALARQLNWSPEAITILEFGALLHDIGKVQVPSQVLNKTDRLTEDEYAILRRHPEIGAQMLQGIDHLKATLPYVLYHHERWDGKGYPKGLIGTEIPIEGRLLAIADSFDAMTSNRAYRPARPFDEGLVEILKHAGRQFDPVMVEAFLQLNLHTIL